MQTEQASSRLRAGEFGCKDRSRRHSRYRVSGAVPATRVRWRRALAAFRGYPVFAAEAPRQASYLESRFPRAHLRLRVLEAPGASTATPSGAASTPPAAIRLRVAGSTALNREHGPRRLSAGRPHRDGTGADGSGRRDLPARYLPSTGAPGAGAGAPRLPP